MYCIGFWVETLNSLSWTFPVSVCLYPRTQPPTNSQARHTLNHPLSHTSRTLTFHMHKSPPLPLHSLTYLSTLTHALSIGCHPPRALSYSLTPTLTPPTHSPATLATSPLHTHTRTRSLPLPDTHSHSSSTLSLTLTPTP